MKTVRLAAYISGLDASGIEVYSHSVLLAMTGNSNFTTPYPSLPVLQTAITELNLAINAAVPSTVTINAKVNYLKKVLNAMKAYVILESDDDADKAASSGFALVEGKTHAAQTFVARQGSVSGTVDLECAYAGNRAAYWWEMSPDPISAWQLVTVTNNSVNTVTGLTPGNKYWFRLRAIVKDKPQDYSDPAIVHVV